MAAGGELDGWTICPRCGGGLVSGQDSARCAACGHVVYANPAPAVCALVEDSRGRVLLGRRAREPYAGLWDVLGGFMEEGEQPLETLRREVREEAGLDVEPGAFVAAVADRYGDTGLHTLNLAWTARVVAGEPRAADDVAELRWFASGRLPPPEQIAFENSRELLRLWRARRDRGGERDVLGVFEVQLVVSGLEAMTAFYRDQVELRVSLEDPARGRTHFSTGRGQLILARAEREADGSPGWPGLPPPLLAATDPRGPTPIRHGPVHFALEASLDRVLALDQGLRAGGIDVRGPFRWPGGRLSIYFRDPEGNVAELITAR